MSCLYIAGRLLAFLVLLIFLLSLPLSSPRSSSALSANDSPAAPNAFIFSNWYTLGANRSGIGFVAPYIGYNQDGRIELIGIDQYSSIWHKFQTAANGDFSTDWDMIGSATAMGCIGIGNHADGRMDLAALTRDTWNQRLWHIWQGYPNAPFTTTWVQFTQPAGVSRLLCPIAVGASADHRIHYALAGDDGNLWVMAESSPNGGFWPFLNFGHPAGGNVSDPAWSNEADGRLVVWALSPVGGSFEIFFRYQVDAAGNWSDWVGMGRPTVPSIWAYALSKNADGREEVFALTATYGCMYHKYQIVPNSYWSGWELLGCPPNLSLADMGWVAAAQTANGTMDVFTEAWDDSVWQIRQTQPSNGWGPWIQIPPAYMTQYKSAVAVGHDANGMLHLFTVGQDNTIWHSREISFIYKLLLPSIQR